MEIVILLGAPGSGKGTIASRLAGEDPAVRHVSSGDLLRGAIAAGTPAGVEAKAYMDKGQLVPDALVVAMIGDVIAAEKTAETMLLDGFPRNVAQAEALERSGAKVRSAVLVDVPDEIIADYMLSYENYYGLEPGTEKYDMVISKNIMLMLPIIAGTDDLESVDLAAATEAYLLKHGMDPDSLAALKDKLSRA